MSAAAVGPSLETLAGSGCGCIFRAGRTGRMAEPTHAVVRCKSNRFPPVLSRSRGLGGVLTQPQPGPRAYTYSRCNKMRAVRCGADAADQEKGGYCGRYRALARKHLAASSGAVTSQELSFKVVREIIRLLPAPPGPTPPPAPRPALPQQLL